MTRIRLWTKTLVAQVDSIVGRIENHEAVAESALRAASRAAARAKVRLARVRRDGEALRERLEAARESEARWRDRAEGLAERDRDAALECLRRRRAAEREVATFERRLEAHGRTERALQADVAAVEDRLSGLRERHHVLATRESRAEAVSGVEDCEVGEVFERWELALAEREVYAGALAETPDAFEADLDRAEEDAALRAELEALCGAGAAAGAGEGAR